jgi:hypothetical protein
MRHTWHMQYTIDFSDTPWFHDVPVPTTMHALPGPAAWCCRVSLFIVFVSLFIVTSQTKREIVVVDYKYIWWWWRGKIYSFFVIYNILTSIGLGEGKYISLSAHIMHTYECKWTRWMGLPCLDVVEFTSIHVCWCGI